MKIQNIAIAFLGMLCLTLGGCTPTEKVESRTDKTIITTDHARFVNPFIGTDNYGATNPGAILPQGMASVVPFNVAFKKGKENKFEKDSEWHSRPYVNENSFLTGFSHVNLSGVGCPDLGSIITMPIQGKLEFDPEKNGTTYSDEKAVPGYYSVLLDDSQIQVEVSATLRAGISKYSLPAGENHVLLNAGLGLTNETGASIRVVSPTEVEGFKIIGDFCYNPEGVRPVYFVMKLSKKPSSYGAWKKMPKFEGVEGAWTKYNDAYKPYEAYHHELAGENLGAYFTFDSDEEEIVFVKLGVSYTSIEQARKNLEEEMPHDDFDRYKKEAYDRWNEMLNPIQVEGSEDQKMIFYSAMYHSLIHPNILQDVDGRYPWMEKYGTGKTDKSRYTVFSLWDTYRNVHPYFCLVYPQQQLEMVESMLDMYDESGWLPKWELLSMETGVMVGDPATPVIADTYLRGLRNFDIDKAYEAMRKSAFSLENNTLRPGISDYITDGIIREGNSENVWGTVSTTLEYNISDYNLGSIAQLLGKEEDAKILLERSKSYQKYFDKSTGMLRPIMKDGAWLTPFDPEAGKNFEAVIGFVEGNAWQYRFYVPHDIENLKNMLGGDQAFEKALDECFETDNYDMANEPDITYPYLYNYISGSEAKSQQKVRELVEKYYFDGPAGIPGNDDTGTLSTWLIFSMMGIYPDCPGKPHYTLTSPIFDRVEIALDQHYYTGKSIIFETLGRKNPDDVIKTIKWNDEIVDGYFIDHADLVKGGTLQFIY